MAKRGFYLNYDQENDILNISFGPAREAISYELEPEVYLRVSPKTHELLGLTVLGFKQSFLSQKQEVHLTPTLLSKFLKEQRPEPLVV